MIDSKILDKIRVPSVVNAINELVRLNPELGMRTHVDIILDTPKDLLAQYPILVKIKADVNTFLQKNKIIFDKIIQEKLEEGLNIGESHVQSLKTNFGLNNYSELALGDVFSSLEEDETRRVVDALLLASTLIPDNYKNNLPAITVIVDDFAHSKVVENSIQLRPHRKLINQISEALHELIHLIEINNNNINDKSVDFLNHRKTSSEKVSIKELSEKYNKVIDDTSSMVYPGLFIHPYMGASYLKDNKTYTEILSTGTQAFLLDPYLLKVRDPELFNLVLSVLKGSL